MKKLLCCLFLFIALVSGFAQEPAKLPTQLWEEIIELSHNERFPFAKWNKDILIGLDGSYTYKDSLEVLRVVHKLDSLTETIRVKMTSFKKANFKIRFLENVKRYPGPIINEKEESYKRVELLNGIDIYNEDFLEREIFNKLINGRFENAKYSNLKRSNSLYVNKYYYFVRHFIETNNKPKVSNEDIAIVREVYSKGFEERLKRAEKEFSYVLHEIKEKKIKARDRSLWWVKNPVSVIFLPILILTLTFLLILKKINEEINNKISSNALRFTIVSAFTLLFLGVLIVLEVSLYDFLTIPDDYTRVPIIRKDTILTTLVILFFFFPLLFLLRYLECQIQKNVQNIYIKTILFFSSTGILPIFLTYCYLKMVLLANSQVFKENEFLDGLAKVALFCMIIAALRALISFFMFKERSLIIENERQLSQLRELKTKAELKSLQSQINPHFLYNSLNSIASLAPIDVGKTQQMAYSLSDLFKYSINRKGKKMSAIQEEIAMVNSYLEIEKIRFGDRLQFDIEVGDSLLEKEIPLFLIQPLVENAVKHGISKSKDQGEILLKIEMKEENLLISVYDNGPEFPEGLVSGHGLQTVYDLLRLSYQDQAFVNWTNTPKKMIQISIPKNS